MLAIVSPSRARTNSISVSVTGSVVLRSERTDRGPLAPRACRRARFFPAEGALHAAAWSARAQASFGGLLLSVSTAPASRHDFRQAANSVACSDVRQVRVDRRQTRLHHDASPASQQVALRGDHRTTVISGDGTCRTRYPRRRHRTTRVAPRCRRPACVCDLPVAGGSDGHGRTARAPHHRVTHGTHPSSQGAVQSGWKQLSQHQ